MTELLPYATERDERAQRTAFFLPLLAAALILALIGVISVVTKGDEAKDPLELLQSAPGAIEDAQSARMAMTFAFDGGGMDMSFGADGLVDFATGAGTFAMDLMGESMEIRTDGETVWIKMPAMGRPAGVAAEWIAIPLEEIPGASMGQQPFPGLGGTSYVDALLGVNDDVEELGEEEVKGFDTRHLRFTVDITAALDQLDGADREEMAGAFETMGGDLTAIPVEAWLTDDGVPVRQVMTFSLAEGGMAGTMRMQIDLTDFGVDVDVEPPPAEDVVSYDQVPGMAGSFGSGVSS